MRFLLDCLECGCPRMVDPLAFEISLCPNCGSGVVVVPKVS